MGKLPWQPQEAVKHIVRVDVKTIDHPPRVVGHGVGALAGPRA